MWEDNNERSQSENLQDIIYHNTRLRGTSFMNMHLYTTSFHSLLIRRFIVLGLLITYSCGEFLSAHNKVPQDTIQGTDTLFIEKSLEDIEISAFHKPMQSKASIPIQSVDARELSIRGIQNVADAVKQFSGTTVRDYGGIGGMKTVSVHSLGAHHTAVAYDGIAISNIQAGQIDIGHFALDNVSVLSLAVGQEENLMQSARLLASGAVLNIQTASPSVSKYQAFSFSPQLKIGSFGEINPSFRYGQQLNEKTTISADINWMRADGRYPFTIQNYQTLEHHKRQNSEIEQSHIELNLHSQLTSTSEWQIKSYYYRSKRGLPGSVILYTDDNKERLWDEIFFTQTKYDWQWTDQWKGQLSAKYSRSYSKYHDISSTYVGGEVTDINRQQEYYVQGTFAYQPTTHLAISWANDGIVNHLDNNLPYGVKPTRYTWLSALTTKLDWKQLVFNGTLLSTYTTTHVSKGDKPADRFKMTPTFSVRYTPIKNYPWHLRMMAKRSYRIPSFNDLYYERIGNKDLKPEVANEYSLGSSWTVTQLPLFDYIKLHVDGFYNEIEDKLVAMPTTYLWKMSNYGRVTIKGIDLSGETAIPLGNRYSLFLSGNYTYQEALDLTDKTSKSYKNQLPYTPKNTGTASAVVHSPWGDINYTFISVGERYSSKQNLTGYRMRPYQEQSLTVSREWSFGNFPIKTSLSCLNFTNEQYQVISYYPMPGRTWKMTIRMDF